MRKCLNLGFHAQLAGYVAERMDSARLRADTRRCFSCASSRILRPNTGVASWFRGSEPPHAGFQRITMCRAESDSHADDDRRRSFVSASWFRGSEPPHAV